MNGDNYKEHIETLLLNEGYSEEDGDSEFEFHNSITNDPLDILERISQQEHIILNIFQNYECIYCNGFYGPCFEESVCQTCHAFLYPNMASDINNITVIPDEDDDSDSGNDEPADNSFPPIAMADHLNGVGEVPQIEVEGLAQRLDRLVVYRPHTDISIDQLPTEVLIYTFQFLDDISMWSVGQVNSRWRSLMVMNTNQDYWRYYTMIRWPLLNTSDDIDDWHDLYTSMMLSSCCSQCIRQMAAREYGTGEESSWRRLRLRSELRMLRTDPPDGIQAKPLDPINSHWQATIIGPEGSVYEGGMFFLYIQIPYAYPMTPPLVRFITKIFHPNISRHGTIGIDFLHSNWSLALTISNVLISIQSLLTDPVCDVCMEPEVGRLYLNDRSVFEEQARIWTWKHAMHQYLPH